MKDSLFDKQSGRPEDFQFSPEVAEVFDDMLGRSVPFYQETIAMAARLLENFLSPRDLIYDLGCSTGATMIELARNLEELDLKFIGVDNSRAMIEKATLKAELYCKKDRLRFIKADILECELDSPRAIIMNYTLQFIRPMMRQEFIQKLYSSLKPGGLLIISEKTLCHNSLFNRAFIQFYLDFKRQHGYSEIEIAKKREALENILVPFSIEENMKLLQQAGFKNCEQFFQWFNFSSFIAIK